MAPFTNSMVIFILYAIGDLEKTIGRALIMAHSENIQAAGIRGLIGDWAADKEAFNGVPWGKAMMWLFLLSDTF